MSISYAFTCGKCGKTSNIADDVQLRMCPQCGAVIKTDRAPTELRPTVIKWPPKEYTEAQKEAFLDECRRLLEKHGPECRFVDCVV